MTAEERAEARARDRQRWANATPEVLAGSRNRHRKWRAKNRERRNENQNNYRHRLQIEIACGVAYITKLEGSDPATLTPEQRRHYGRVWRAYVTNLEAWAGSRNLSPPTVGEDHANDHPNGK